MPNIMWDDSKVDYFFCKSADKVPVIGSMIEEPFRFPLFLSMISTTQV